MRLLFGRRLRHPFYPDLVVTPAGAARRGCAAIAGSVPELARAAAAGVRPRRAVFPLYRAGAPFLTAAERDLLWEMFEVPLFVLLLDAAGRVTGCECEAQDGLHVQDGYPGPGTIETEPCPCGRPGPRIKVAEELALLTHA